MHILQHITKLLAEKVSKKQNLEKKNKIITIGFISIVAICFYGMFGIIALINQIYLLTVVLTVAAVINYFVLYDVFKSFRIDFGVSFIVSSAAFVFLYCLATGGAFGTGYLWIFPFPVLTIALNGIRKGTLYSTLFLILVIAVCIINLHVPALPDYELSLSLRLIGAYLAIHCISYIFEYLRLENMQAMESWIIECKNDNRRKDDFLSELSHQMRTPLNNITLISNLVDRSKLATDQQDLFDTIIASTNNLVSVVNNIVKVSAFDVEENEQTYISYNIETTIKNTLKLFEDQHKNKLSIDFKVLSKRVHFKGNPVRIKQLFLNLIENLLKIGIKEKMQIGITLDSQLEDKENSLVAIDITFPAIQMVKDEHNNYLLNGKFSSPTKNDFDKNYMDFNIARRLVGIYKGMFTVQIKKDMHIISIILHLKNDDQKSENIETKPVEEVKDLIETDRKQSLEDVNILLVEDNSINQKIVILSLKNKVKSIDVANNGKEALDKFGTTKYDIILMDIQMPVMNGIVATKKIRELESSTNTHTPIIAITANALSGDKEVCLAAGMNDYISKPFQVEMLLKKMKKLIIPQTPE